MQFTIIDYEKFFNIVKAVQKLTTEALFIIDSELRVVFYDKSNISLSILFYKQVVFGGNESTEFGVSTSDLTKFTKGIKGEVSFVIGDVITITHGSKKITLPIISDVTPMSKNKHERVVLPISFNIPNAAFIDVLEILGGIDNSFSLQAKGNKIKIESSDGIKSYSDTLCENVPGEAQSRFSTEITNKITLPASICDTVKISIGENLPIQLDYITAEWEFYVIAAPRIENV